MAVCAAFVEVLDDDEGEEAEDDDVEALGEWQGEPNLMLAAMLALAAAKEVETCIPAELRSALSPSLLPSTSPSSSSLSLSSLSFSFSRPFSLSLPFVLKLMLLLVLKSVSFAAPPALL